ncbi:MAG: hypothetical protein AAF587_22805 [Bacteroidota bacterium]
MRVELDKTVYKLLLQHKQNSHDTGRKGETQDLDFLHEDLWLQDTAVFDWVAKLNGSWQVFLVFVHYKNPFLLIKRFIKTQISFRKANIEAHYMRRLAAKDQRGTLEVEKESLSLCEN